MAAYWEAKAVSLQLRDKMRNSINQNATHLSGLATTINKCRDDVAHEREDLKNDTKLLTLEQQYSYAEMAKSPETQAKVKESLRASVKKEIESLNREIAGAMRSLPPEPVLKLGRVILYLKSQWKRC